MRRPVTVAVAGVLLTAALSVVVQPPAQTPVVPASEPRRAAATTAAAAAADRPLAGRVIVLDPGHQLGNSDSRGRPAGSVPAGGFRKPCNTTGTATRGGFPEATFTWQVSAAGGASAARLGATVVLTRTANSRRLGARASTSAGGRATSGTPTSSSASMPTARTPRGARGFHVIAPPDRRPWTHDIWRESRAFARATRAALRAAGVPMANYTAGGDGLAVRRDLGTLNLSDVPVVMVELGNMRHRGDARRMTRPAGRAIYARALVRAVLARLAP